MSPVNDDEKTGTRYNYSYFHVIFVLATMYTACLLTKCVLSPLSCSAVPSLTVSPSSSSRRHFPSSLSRSTAFTSLSLRPFARPSLFVALSPRQLVRRPAPLVPLDPALAC